MREGFPLRTESPSADGDDGAAAAGAAPFPSSAIGGAFAQPAGPALWSYRSAVGELDLDEMAQRHLGVEKSATPFTLRQWIDATHADDRMRVSDAFERMEAASAMVTVEFRTKRRSADHGERWLALYGCSDHSRPEVLATASGMLIDISAYRAAAEMLRARDEQLQSIVSAVPAAMVVSDERGTIISFNPVAERVFGYQAHEVIGQNVGLLMPAPDRALHDGYLNRRRMGGGPRIIGIGRVVSAMRKDGTPFPIELSLGEAHGPDGLLYTAFIQDLTERYRTEARMRELQAELMHESRLSVSGTMASMLAHEVTQPLTAIANYVSAAADILDEPPEEMKEVLRDALREAAEQSIRAGEIIRRLRDFVTRGDIEKQAEPLAQLIDEAVALGLHGSTNVKVRSEIDPDLIIFGDRIQIQQVIVNLIRNSAEAMQDMPVAEIGISAQRRTGELVEIGVRDTGPGVDHTVLDQLFQPLHLDQGAWPRSGPLNLSNNSGSPWRPDQSWAR